MPYNSNNIPYAKRLRKEMTPWERKLWYCYLSKHPVRFQRQKPVGDYIVDFYCAACKLAIELDGGGHYTEESAQKDAIRTNRIKQQGIEVIRFCNLDVDKNFEGVCSAIDAIVKQRYRRGDLPPSL